MASNGLWRHPGAEGRFGDTRRRDLRPSDDRIGGHASTGRRGALVSRRVFTGGGLRGQWGELEFLRVLDGLEFAWGRVSASAGK